MKDKLLVFAYNVRHQYPDPQDPQTFKETDFDDEETISSMGKHLRSLGLNLLSLESDLEAEGTLRRYRDKIGLVFNYSEIVLGSIPKIYLAEILEKLKLPFTGCSSRVQKTVIDKSKMKNCLLKKHLPTLPYQIFESSAAEIPEGIKYPVIVKPVAQGSSAGITNRSIVSDDKALKRQIEEVTSLFEEPALVEKYLPGREFSVGMLGNPPRTFPIIEPRREKIPKGYFPIDSLEVKWLLEEELGEDYFTCPAKLPSSRKKAVEELCRAVWEALGIRDFCRIDLREDLDGDLFVLDVNTPPGLIPPDISATSYFPFAARRLGIDYEELLLRVIQAAEKRHSP